MPRPPLLFTALALLLTFGTGPLLRAQAPPSVASAATPAAAAPQLSWPLVYLSANDPAAGALATRIAALLQEPSAARAHWGVAVTTLDGTPLYGLAEAQLFRPASTAKLFTTAVAMEVLGASSTVKTIITGDLNSTTGTLTGDLNLVGGGDSSFNTHDLPYQRAAVENTTPNDLTVFADTLIAHGLRHITGNVVGNDTTFGHEPPPEGWAAEDLWFGYGTLPSALSVSDNEISLTLSPSPDKTPRSQLTLDQMAPYLQVTNGVVTEAAATPPVSLTLMAPSQPAHLFTLDGHIGPGTHLTEHLAVDDPALYAAQSLRLLLQQRGVTIDGDARPLHTNAFTNGPWLTQWRELGDCGWAAPISQGCAFDCLSDAYSRQVLATHTSAPLLADITFTLKTSANLHAENMLRLLGLRNGCPGSSAVYGAALVRRFLLHAGLPDGDFVFYDGSGLSTKDLVTPRAEAELLAYAARQPWFPQWKAALPVGGVDGTLASRFREPPLQGKVFAKTGTLGETRTLAGYVLCASGREVIFSILEDNHLPGGNDTATMDAIVAAIAAAD